MLHALFDRGLRPSDTHVLGKCYSTNRHVREALQSDGVDVLPQSTEYDPRHAYDEMIDKHVRQLTPIAADAAKAQRPIIILDSGGHLLHAVNNDLDIQTDRVVGIEQTSSGFHALKNEPIRFPVLNVARSKIKLDVESPWIADAVVGSLLDKLKLLPSEWNRFKQDVCVPELRIQGKKARGMQLTWREHFEERMRLVRPPKRMLNSLIIGGGAIGKAIHERMLSGPKIFDVQRQRRIGFLRNIRHAISQAHVIIGATGTTSVPAHLHKYLHHQVVLASAGSSDREFDAVHLRQNLDKETGCHKNSSITIPGTNKRAHLLSQGFPINFDGYPEPVPLQKIQLTSALLMSAVLDAHRYMGQKGIIEYPQDAHPLIKQFVEEESNSIS